MYVCMYGWMEGWVGRWMDGRLPIRKILVALLALCRPTRTFSFATAHATCWGSAIRGYVPGLTRMITRTYTVSGGPKEGMNHRDKC